MFPYSLSVRYPQTHVDLALPSIYYGFWTFSLEIPQNKRFLRTRDYLTTDHLNKIDSLIACIDTENIESIIIGDTNCDFIKPTNYTTHLKRIIIMD